MIRHGAARMDGEMVYLTNEWEVHRFSGKQRLGQRSLADALGAWRPVLEEIGRELS
jgi:hypothetical protein